MSTFREFTEQILVAIAEFFGATGPVESNVIIGFLLLVLALVLLLILMFVFSKGSAAKGLPEEGSERLGSLMGKTERLERTINEAKTEILRSTEFTKAEILYLREEIEDVKSLLQEKEPALRVRKAKEPAQPEVTQEQVSEAHLQPEELEIETEEAAPSESLSRKLKSSRLGLFTKIRSIFSKQSELDDDMLEELEALLVTSDLGLKTASALILEVKEDVKNGEPVDEQSLVSLLKMKVLNILEEGAPIDPSILPEKKGEEPLVVMMVGVNGVGKTTTVAKLAAGWKEAGAKVMMVAGDTFRAAAVEQLSEWSRRIGVSLVSGAPEAKPGSVVFDAMVKAKAEEYDVVVVDTAGRLHTKSNLMQELQGVRNVIQKHQPSAPHETILVVDGSTGQNAVTQAKEFHGLVPLTGVIVTKLDGTPKGGVVVAIKDELNIPVRYIGVGESVQDLRPFLARDFVEALFDTESAAAEMDSPSAHGETRRRRRKDTQEYFDKEV